LSNIVFNIISNYSSETLPLRSTASDATFEIDVWRYFHPDATKTVYLQVGIHGIELTGIPVVHEFMKGIEEHQLVYNTEYGVFRM
jgi:predicted deacylase